MNLRIDDAGLMAAAVAGDPVERMAVQHTAHAGDGDFVVFQQSAAV